MFKPRKYAARSLFLPLFILWMHAWAQTYERQGSRKIKPKQINEEKKQQSANEI